MVGCKTNHVQIKDKNRFFFKFKSENRIFFYHTEYLRRVYDFKTTKPYITNSNCVFKI